MTLENQEINRKCYNTSVCVKTYNKIRIYNIKLVNYKVTIFVLIRIEIKIMYEFSMKL